MMPRPIMLAAAALLAACGDAVPTAPASPRAAAHAGAGIRVTTAADDGAGSLRAAIASANADPSIGAIRVERGVGAIALRSPIVFTGAQALTIDGGGATLAGDALPDASQDPATDAALVANGGGDLTVRDLTIRGSRGSGLIVDVPGGRTGAVTITLDDLRVEHSRRHGVLVNDQVDYFADPLTRAEGGSPADVRLRVSRSTFVGNGFAGLDFDGIRVNEGGPGSLDVDVAHSRLAGNGADGLELDERAAGDAVFSVRHTDIEANGFFSAEDWDDGIDVDELGPGGIDGRFLHVVVSGNAEQGVDLNENNLGDLRVTMHQLTANGNAEEGVELEEDDDFEDFPAESWGGSVVATLVHVTANGNGANDGDAGLKLREKAAGDLTATLVRATALDNAIGGIQLREGEAGNLAAELRGATALRNAGAGIELRESADGALRALVQQATSSANDGAGLRLRGSGEARVVALVADGNAAGDLVSEPAVVVTRVP